MLRLGITAGSKKYSDALMIVNLRNGFSEVMSIDQSACIDLDYLCDMHKMLMENLLPKSEQGLVRTSGVKIGASSYTPLTNPMKLREELKFILDEANKYTNSFEKAIYLHNNLAYLQYFRDGNKRTARMIQTASLVKDGITPLFFNDTLITDYMRATVNYYEIGKYEDYVKFFKENYTMTIESLNGHSYEESNAPQREKN